MIGHLWRLRRYLQLSRHTTDGLKPVNGVGDAYAPGLFQSLHGRKSVRHDFVSRCFTLKSSSLAIPGLEAELDRAIHRVFAGGLPNPTTKFANIIKVMVIFLW